MCALKSGCLFKKKSIQRYILHDRKVLEVIDNLWNGKINPTQTQSLVCPQLRFLSSLFYFLLLLSDLNCTSVLRREDSPTPAAFSPRAPVHDSLQPKNFLQQNSYKETRFTAILLFLHGAIVGSSCYFGFIRPVHHSPLYFPETAPIPRHLPNGDTGSSPCPLPQLSVTTFNPLWMSCENYDLFRHRTHMFNYLPTCSAGWDTRTQHGPRCWTGVLTAPASSRLPGRGAGLEWQRASPPTSMPGNEIHL